MGTYKHEIVDQDDTGLKIVPLAVALCTVFLVGVVAIIASIKFGEWEFAGFGFGVSVVAGISMRSKFRDLKAWKTFHAGTLHLDQWPLNLGTKTKLRFIRKQKRLTKITDVQLRLYLEEWVQWRQGSSVETKTATVWATNLSHGPVTHGSDILVESEVELPDDLPTSFDAPNNKLLWKVEAKVSYEDSTDDSSFVLLVRRPAA